MRDQMRQDCYSRDANSQVPKLGHLGSLEEIPPLALLITDRELDMIRFLLHSPYAVASQHSVFPFALQCSHDLCEAPWCLNLLLQRCWFPHIPSRLSL